MSPATSSDRRTSWTATATGSTSAACRSDASSGRRTTTCSGTVQSSCSDPGESMPMKLRWWHRCWCPAWHAGHVPSQSSGITVTRSPTSVVTPSRGGHRAAHLVAEHQRSLDPAVHVAVHDVQVGAAEAGVGHLDLDLTRSRTGGSSLRDANGAIPPRKWLPASSSKDQMNWLLHCAPCSPCPSLRRTPCRHSMSKRLIRGISALSRK